MAPPQPLPQEDAPVLGARGKTGKGGRAKEGGKRETIRGDRGGRRRKQEGRGSDEGEGRKRRRRGEGTESDLTALLTLTVSGRPGCPTDRAERKRKPFTAIWITPGRDSVP